MKKEISIGRKHRWRAIGRKPMSQAHSSSLILHFSLRKIVLLLCLTCLGTSQAFATNADRLSKDLPDKSCNAALLWGLPDQRHDQAMLSDARMGYRLCNTRPQRLVPVQGGGHGKSHGKPSFAAQHKSKPPKAFHDRRRKAETLPLRLVASCDYYVIALRHIIR